MARFLVLGEINADVVLEGLERLPQPGHEVRARSGGLTLGSSSAIAASGLARLGNSVTFLGHVGEDALGKFCLSEMARLGIDVERVQVVPGEATGVTVSLSQGGDRALVTYPGAIETFAVSEVPDGFDHLHVGAIFLQTALRPRLGALLRDARAKGLSTSLDPGHDPVGHFRLEGLLDALDWIFPNERELAALSGQRDRLAAFRALAPARTIAKLGAEGAAALVEDELVLVPAPEVDVRDTTGAGDSFDAGFLHAWIRGATIVECVRYGVAAGSLSTRAPGGTAAQPDLEELEAFSRRSAR